MLADGSRVRTRPIEPADRDALADGFARLSARSRYRRFLGPKHTLSARELTYLTEVDHVTHEAVVAFDEADDRMVGVARYAVWPGLGRHRRRRRHGRRRLARARPRLGADRARGRLCARERHQAPDRDDLWENAAASALMRRLGFRAVGSGDGALEFRLDLARLP